MDYTTFKLNKDFKRLYGRGKRIVLPQIVVYYKKNNLNYCRIGVCVSKKIGCAVKRNRAKRVIWAVLRQLLPSIEDGYDFVIAGRVRATFVKSTVVLNATKNAFINEGIIKNEKIDN